MLSNGSIIKLNVDWWTAAMFTDMIDRSVLEEVDNNRLKWQLAVNAFE